MVLPEIMAVKMTFDLSPLAFLAEKEYTFFVNTAYWNILLHVYRS